MSRPDDPPKDDPSFNWPTPPRSASVGVPGASAELTSKDDSQPLADSLVEQACDNLIEHWRRGDRRTVESYCRRWPDGEPGPDDLFEMIYTEYLVRVELGDPAFEPLAGRFPEHADRLRRQIAMHEFLQESDNDEKDEGDPGLTATRVDSDAPAGSSTASWASLIGYEIKRVLGRGGMGVVYEARQIRLNRPVALKMIRAGVHASDEDRSRFLAEAEVIARLRHPNIVQVHAFGESDGQPYFEMEFVDGGSLADQLDGTPRPPREASKLLETIARAIHEAHRQAVVHRDLKPSNILLMADGTPKIVDFGLAKMIGADSGLTRTDSILGSPAYMAPEQASGQARDVGPAADVFALGAIYYEMLTGRPPFVAESALETIDLVRNAEPIPPSQLRPGLPRDVETIGLRCLSKDPSRRYATAEALADDIGRWLRGESILARPTGPLERGYRWSLRNRAVASLIASIVLILIGGTSGMAVLWARARTEAANARQLAGKEERAKLELARVTADLTLDRGLALAESGDSARGLPFMARAVQLDPDGLGSLGGAARANLEAWSPLVPRPCRSVPLPSTSSRVALTPDQRISLIGGQDGSLSFRDNVRSLVLHTTGPRPGGPITRVAIRRDGLVAASISGDEGLVQLWDVPTGHPFEAPLKTSLGYAGIAFRPDGLALAVSCDSNLWFWEYAKGGPVGEPIRFPNVIKDLAFSPDGSTLVVVNSDDFFERRDGRNGRLIGERVKLDSVGWSVAFHPDGSRFAVGFGGPHDLARPLRRDRSGVQCFDTATGQPIGPRLHHGIGVHHLAYRPDGHVLLSGDFDGQARFWDEQGRPIGDPLRNEGEIQDLAFSPDGSIALTQSSLGPIRLWDTTTSAQVGAALDLPGGLLVGFSDDAALLRLAVGDRLRSFDLSEVVAPALYSRAAMKHLRFSPRDPWFVGVIDRVAQIVSTVDGRPIGWPMPHQEIIQVVDISPDGRLIASGSRDATVRIWDAEGRPVIPPIPIRHWASAIRFSPDSRRLLVSDETGDVRLIDVATGTALGPSYNHPSHAGGSHVFDLFFSKSGDVGYSVASSGTVGRVDGFSGKPIADLWDYSGKIDGDQASPDTRTLLLVHRNSIRLIDLATGLDRFPPVGRGVRSACYTPDGRTIVGGCDDKVVRFWDAATGRSVGSPIAHPRPVGGVGISPDGRTLFTVGDDGLTRTWDLASRKQIGPTRSHDPAFAKSTFSADGRFLAVTEQATRLYPVPIPEAKAEEAGALPARVAELTGLELDAQGGITFSGESTSPGAGDSAADADVSDWHARVAADLELRGHPVSALWHLDRHVIAHPDDWQGHACRSELLARLGRPAESEAEADRARRLAGPTLAARWDAERGFDAFSERRWADAIAAFDRVLAAEAPDRSLFHDARGWAKAHLKQWAEASADLSAGSWKGYSMMNNFDYTVLVALAAEDQAFYRQLMTKLVPAGEKGRVINPQLGCYKAWLGSLGPGALDDPNLLIRQAEPASRIVGDPGDLEFRMALGLTLYRAGRFQAAIDQLTQVHQGKRIDELFDSRIFLAMAHQRLGQTSEARAWLQRAEELPVSHEERESIARMVILREAKAVVLDSGFPTNPFRLDESP